jgi:trans-4-hydroxy-L-proline dehydratase
MNERIGALKAHIQKMNDDGPRRTTFFPLIAESLSATRGEHTQLRRAKAFAHLLDCSDQAVLPHETLVGSNSGTWTPTVAFEDYATMRSDAMDCIADFKSRKARHGPPAKESRFALISRDHYDANIDYAEMQRLIKDVQTYFEGDEVVTSLDVARELEEHFVFDYGDDVEALFSELPWFAANHLNLDYERLLVVGFGGLVHQIKKHAASATGEQNEFYEAARIVTESAIRYIRRYALTVRKTASESSDLVRITELKIIADRLERMATEPAETFQEAMQLLWITHIVANLAGGTALSFARFDQYMAPYYAAGLNDSTVGAEEARTLISCLWLKVNEPKMRTVQSMALGGVDAEGADASNALTRLCLEVCADLRQPFPNTSLRIHPGTPEDLYDLALESVLRGSGNPMMLNDAVWIPAMLRRGYELPDAREYYNMGCVEMMISACQPYWQGVGGVSFPVVLNEVLTTASGQPEAFSTFEELFDAYITAVQVGIRGALSGADDYIKRTQGRYYDPFGSVLVRDCLERGVDLYQGGSRYPVVFGVGGSGLGTAIDSLSAIKKFVFDEGTIGLNELVEGVHTDFRENETLMRMLDSQTPCFGNDLAEIDEMARVILRTYTEAVQSLNQEGYPGTFVSSLFSYTSQVSGGERTGATPNGRRSGAPLSDNAGPTQGKDTGGPTLLLNSMTRLELDKVTGAFAMNVKIGPDLLRNPKGRESFKHLVKTYFASGGLQVQVNCVDQKTLEQAKTHPELHRDLIVRVAGFSEYFNNLDANLQDEIIQRAAHTGL